jgi:histone demethylase JARID1
MERTIDVVTHSKQVDVEWNDIDTQEFGSGFAQSERGRSIYSTKNLEKMNQPEPKFGDEDYYKETRWNLNNIPCAPDSVLRHVRVGINGINVPWMYYGSLFTTFCWHNEDNHLYSINYHHKGAPKQWYGVPGTKEAADGLEKVFKSYLSMKMRVPLLHITTMFSPRLCKTPMSQSQPIQRRGIRLPSTSRRLLWSEHGRCQFAARLDAYGQMPTNVTARLLAPPSFLTID